MQRAHLARAQRVRWQGEHGGAFLRPAPARSRTVQRQPAVTAVVVGETAERLIAAPAPSGEE